MASAAFELERAKREAVAVWTVFLHFPAFEDLGAKDFYWSTGKNIELEDGNVYKQTLTQIPRGRHQRGRGNDYGDFTAANVDYALYQELLPYQNLIEKCEVTIRKAYAVDIDLYHSDIEFIGYLKDFTLDDTDKSFKFTVNSDMSRPNFLVGNRILTRERCGTEFNLNGLNSPTYHLCGWQTAQGGNPIFCSKLLDGVDGCNAHNNSARFYAVTGLNTADVTITQNGGDDWPGSGSGSCFSEKMFVLMADWSIKPIHKVTARDRHMGFDLFDDSTPIEGEVLDTFKTLVDEIHIADFDLARLEVRKNHLFQIEPHTFAPVAFLGNRPALGLDTKKNTAKSYLMHIQASIETLFVYNLRTNTNNYMVCDKDARFFYKVHNSKNLDF